jgi:hypothetical protein
MGDRKSEAGSRVEAPQKKAVLLTSGFLVPWLLGSSAPWLLGKAHNSRNQTGILPHAPVARAARSGLNL